MAKDGTNRGGARAGAGRKRKALADKITEGSKNTLTLINSNKNIETVENEHQDFIKSEQFDGSSLPYTCILNETMEWLKKYNCQNLVSYQLVSRYAMSVSRWIQCENAITKHGLIGAHPTTGGEIASPYVKMAQDYYKQTQQAWGQIYQIVKENVSVDIGSSDSMMDQLLSRY